MMKLRLGAVADDYTGASDLANTLTKAGLRTIQTIGVPAEGMVLPDAEAVVVALKIRSIAADQAVARAREAAQWLRDQGATHVMYKVCSTFDSTDEGNIGPVLDALRAEAGEAVAVVTPSFPETGRSVFMGHLFTGTVLLSDSPMKDHPLNPMRDSDLVRVLARQSKAPVGLVDAKTVAEGAEAIKARLKVLAETGHGAAIADAIFDGDLTALGQACLGARFSVGASGLGLGLARAVVTARGEAGSGADVAGGQDVGGLSLCLAGSCSQATLGQVAAAEAIMPVLRLDSEKLVTEAGAEIAKAIDWASKRIARGPVLVSSSDRPENVQALQARFGSGPTGHAIEAAMASIASALVERGVRRLIVAGGETSGAVVDGLGFKAFLLGPEIAPGVPVLRVEGTGTPMLLALKSGNFGGPDFFARALSMMQ